MSGTRIEHWAYYYSPGTFLTEESHKKLDSADVKQAVALAEGIVERYNAKPFGFRLVELLVHDPVPDGRGGTMSVEPKSLRSSGIYFIGGRLRLYEDVLADNKSDERILLDNMRCNRMWVVVENTNSYKSTIPFSPDDVLLNAQGEVVERGNSKRLREYAEVMTAKYS